MALSESKAVEWQPGEVVSYATSAASGAAPIYGGALVGFAAGSGLLVPAGDTQNLRFAGVALEPGAGGQMVRVHKTGVVRMGFSGGNDAVMADIGKTVYAVADDVVALDTTYDIAVGTITAIEAGGTAVRVRVDGAVR